MSAAKLTPGQFNAWLVNLRSGAYSQTDGVLKREVDGTCGHCCLGVLAETVGPLWMDPDDDASTSTDWKLIRLGAIFHPGASDYLPSQFLDHELQEKLADMNDGGMTFGEIADYLERNRADYVQEDAK